MARSTKIWSTKLVTEVLKAIETGIPADTTCFWAGDPQYRGANINFDLTKSETEEFVKCAGNVIYFADKYCHAMTDEGIANIKMREYQKKMLSAFQDNRFVIMLASRQIGKTITSGIFLAWYLCFHYDRNCLIVANKQATAGEIVSKIKTIIKNLPFFLKPGVNSGGQLGLTFDNGCRLFSQATTKTAALGYAIHLLYADEFAHIPNNLIVPFYRSIYPTLSSSKISKIIISSTPNGINLFHKIYTDAIEKVNAYTPIRVDWWEVPGRDDAWKDQEIANLGSPELFEQEYGNKFIANSTMLLSGRIVELSLRIAKSFIWKEIFETELLNEEYNHLSWHPNFDPNNINSDDKFIISVDLSDGVGRDYTAFTIFKLGIQSIPKIRKLKEFNDETDFFRLTQVGKFHSNITSVEQASTILDMLIFNVFDSENITVILEMNFKGNYFLERLRRNIEFYDGILLYSKHTLKAAAEQPGVKLNKDNKQLFCRELKTLMNDCRIIVTDVDTISELSQFGLTDKGSYQGQGSHDDLAMTCVNLVTYFDSNDFIENVEDTIDYFDNKITSAIYKKIGDDDADDAHINLIKWFGDNG